MEGLVDRPPTFSDDLALGVRQGEDASDERVDPLRVADVGDRYVVLTPFVDPASMAGASSVRRVRRVMGNRGETS